MNNTFINRRCRFCDNLQTPEHHVELTFPYDATDTECRLLCRAVQTQGGGVCNNVATMSRCPRM